MRFDTDSDKPDAEAMLNLTRELHAHLVTVLAEKFGDALTVEEAEDPENGLVGYRFEIHGAVCSAGIAPFDGTAAVLSLNGWLGRIHHRYAEALGWLANNRAFNTLALAHRHAHANAGDLWVAANRNTLSGDIAGIRFELDDFCNELKRAITGIRLWFPQFFDAAAIAEFEADGNEAMAFALRSPQEALEAFERSEKLQQENPILYCYVTRWLGEWVKNLEMNNSPQIKALAEENPGLSAALPIAKLRALRELGRYDEVMSLLPSIPEDRLKAAMKAALHAECLCKQDRAEDAFEHIQSADQDGEPWVHFIRSLACVKLKKFEEAADHLRIYEILIGADAIAHRTLTDLLPENEEEGSEE